jgi:23S rRNA (uracil1939-C5)-methyltransferase
MTRLCLHFGICGGCSFQNMPREAYSQMKRDLVVGALARHGFDDVDVHASVEVSPGTRRRATLAFATGSDAAETGFRAARSHAIVDLRECLVLVPPLTALIRSFRDLLPSLLRAGAQGELALTECDNGIDLALNMPRKMRTRLSPVFADWARRKNVARIVANDEIVVQFDNPIVRLADVEVAVPPNSFLQPTREGESILQETVCAALKGAARIVDLFAGCGTFTFAVARRASVHAVDSDNAALSALQGAVRTAQKLKPVTTEARNLFSLPLQRVELGHFDAAILDPPRAGASAQAAMLAGSAMRRVAYVSCNPESFARDARILAGGGFRIAWVKPVDQFLWSSHIELAALLERH